jgi:elongation factor P--(R)-beta-lysine ligase
MIDNIKLKTWQNIKNNPELINNYLVREKVIDTIRMFLKKAGFHEVQTPILVPTPSMESNLDAFETRLTTSKGISKRAFLIMSPEYAHKKLLSAGLKNIFEITRSFRNQEEISPSHNPEFTILEWYRTNSNYFDIMNDFQDLFLNILNSVCVKFDQKNWKFQNEFYDLTPPWTKISMCDAFDKFANIDTDTLLDENKLIERAKDKGYKIEKGTNWEQIFYQIFLNEIEPKIKDLKKPVFIYDYPLSQAALAKRKKEDPRFAERFEIYLAGLELGNCFSELTDAKEQEQRLKNDFKERKRLNKNSYPIDKDFILALKSGLPEVAGIAVGVDRLIMLASDTDSIEKTLFFPASEIFNLETEQ